MAKKSAEPSPAIKRILAIDIGGTGLKAAVIGPKGQFLLEHVRIKTPFSGPMELCDTWM